MSRRKHRSGTPEMPLTVISPSAPAPSREGRSYARWRALSLTLVYVLVGLHIAHWKITGRTMAPLELNEVMYTLELGIITAGFIFMSALVLGTAIFGRFFCSWACHILALQDTSAWLLSKLGIRPKQVRSRLLLFVPPLTAFYMFLWPQVLRTWRGRALPGFHLASDADGWASLATTDFWRNLPGPWVIAITFLVCGFAVVYLLGSRSFCTYVCPYGAVFSLADRIAPGKIRVDDSCRQCGRCTGVCSSGVRVHEEVREHGMVVNPSCLKDLDCVSVCPQQALSYGFGRPAMGAARAGGSRFGIPYDFTRREEAWGGVCFIITLLSLRGLYGQVPFLLSLAVAGIASYVGMTLLLLRTRPHVTFASQRLKLGGAITTGGRTFIPLALLGVLFVAHSGFVRFHEFTGLRSAVTAERLDSPMKRRSAGARAYAALKTAQRWALVSNPVVARACVSMADLARDEDGVDDHARQWLQRHPTDHQVRLTLARSLLRRERWDDGTRELNAILETGAAVEPAVNADRFQAHELLASIHARHGRFDKAIAHCEDALQLRPASATTLGTYGAALAEVGRYSEAIQALQRAWHLDPSLLQPGYNLGTLLMHVGRTEEAVEQWRQVVQRHNVDADTLSNFGLALARQGDWSASEARLRQAIALDLGHRNARMNLTRLLTHLGRSEESQELARQANEPHPNDNGS